jgi:hypothetical protein
MSTASRDELIISRAAILQPVEGSHNLILPICVQDRERPIEHGVLRFPKFVQDFSRHP